MKWEKCVFLGVTLIFLIFLFFVFSSHRLILDENIGDINGDNENESIVLMKRAFRKYGEEIIIYSNDGKEIYREDFSELKPWKVAVGDVDGDGICEISIGVYKETLFHPIMAKRPFVYNFVENSLHPKWRGSRLSRPFTDYIFYDIDGDKVDELISIEILDSGDKVINTYKWKGFGFESFVQSSNYEDIFTAHEEDDLVHIEYSDAGHRVKGVLNYCDGILTIERVVGDV